MVTRTIPTLIALALAAPASAQNVRVVDPYGPAYASEYGCAGEFVRGTYIGAPLTRGPRPTQIGPAPWSYGTYGVPTVTGISAPPAAQPTVTVINAGGPDGRHRGRAVAVDRMPGARIVAVRVPRR